MSDIRMWLEKKLLQLNLTNSMDVPEGFTRLSYTEDEARAHHEFRSIAADLELSTFTDNAGNQWAVWETDSNAPTVAVGSHLDTVHNGGGYDGVAGVLCGLAAVKILKDQHFTPQKNIAIICFASEESARFGVSTIGSKAIAGLLDKEEQAGVTDAEGTTIKDAVNSFGADWDVIEQAEQTKDALESFIELHIEQGTRIENNNADIGIVRGVACPIRLKVTANGMANHTGTTPMHARKDAFAAISPLVSFVEQEAKMVSSTKAIPLVATVSTVKLWPNAMNVIPGKVEFGIDIRSVDDASKHNMVTAITAYSAQIEARTGVEIVIDTLVDNNSVFLAPSIQEKLRQASQNLGFKSLLMDSGAGHDVMNMAMKWPSGLIFIPCEKGISHHPNEHARLEDLQKGTHVIAEYLRKETGEIHGN
ncbi:M20 family metallo-hydrolase [Thalassobacillus pellis]|uniref:M20 family metallo-hydrolase n=1 Tax=Thalassobacillus pellis TaxID=748008 RepID=UPI0019601A72|nr:M20 family metallo-hydrolase [Thalassobacillus pellis]MBM7552007.1 N-carbamoyl-L-amino-acid hydrolase [Thalassobacillus pellis]